MHFYFSRITTMGLSTLIDQVQRNTVADDGGKWRQFILDHLNYISLRSTVFVIEPTLMNLYRYDLRRFLKDYLHRHEDITWIVQLLNMMQNDFAFEEVTNLIVPEDSLITKLYQVYATISANSK